MRLSIIYLLGFFEASLAFQSVQNGSKSSHFMAARGDEGGSKDIMQSTPFREINVDMNRVQDCVGHFGKCSVKEMKQLKVDLHDRRIQNLVFGDTVLPDNLFQEKFFEEELSLQLNLLQEEAPPSYLFPEVDGEMEGLPHLKDAKAKLEIAKEQNTMMVEELAEEGVLDSLAICALLGVVMMAPQFIMG